MAKEIFAILWVDASACYSAFHTIYLCVIPFYLKTSCVPLTDTANIIVFKASKQCVLWTIIVLQL